MFLGESIESKVGHRLYNFKCDLQISDHCRKTYTRTRLIRDRKHICKACHNKLIASKGGKIGGPKVGSAHVASGHWKQCLALAHTPEIMRKSLLTRMTRGQGMFTSKAEQRFYEECTKRFNDVRRQIFLNAESFKTSIDIYLPEQKIYIEVDGVYWHGLEKPYNQLEPRIKRKFDKDRMVDLYCEQHNLILFRITDKQINDENWNWLFDKIYKQNAQKLSADPASK